MTNDSARSVEPGDADGTRRIWLGSPRIAAAVFGIAVLAALPTILYFGRNQWFFIDEWSFLAGRPFGVDGVLDDHNGHWVSTPFLLFRSLYSIFGIRTYLPYQLLATLSHLGAVVLSRLVMRRIGVGPWTATMVACFLLLLGSGLSNLVFAFQVSLNGSVVCGLGALLLADHGGPIGRRDAAALGVTMVGLTTSAVMIPLVAAVGVATLIRRGPRVAVLHTIPPAVVFAAWFLAFGRDGSSAGAFSFANFARFFVDMNRAVFLGLGDFGLAAIVLAVTAAVGAAAAWRDQADRGPLAMVVALLVAWWGFALVTSAGRNELLEVSSRAPFADRYLHVGTMLLLPLVALGIEQIMRARRLVATLPVAALIVGVPGNVDALANQDRFLLGSEDFVETMAVSRFIDQVPPSHRLSQRAVIEEFGPMTAGWLRRARASGDIAAPEQRDHVLDLYADLRVAFAQRDDADVSCAKQSGPFRARVDAGDRIMFDGNIAIEIVDPDPWSAKRLMQQEFGSVVEVLAGPIDIDVVAADGGPPTACLAPR